MSGGNGDRFSLPEVDALSRYDVVLGVIPLSFVASLFAGELLSIDPQAGLAVASIVGLLALVDALLLNPPRGPGSGQTST